VSRRYYYHTTQLGPAISPVGGEGVVIARPDTEIAMFPAGGIKAPPVQPSAAYHYINIGLEMTEGGPQVAYHYINVVDPPVEPVV
jgi:hypothetical protein